MNRKPRRCKDCAPDAKRPAPHPGPRCATHHKATLKRRQATAHEQYVQNRYGLAPGDYELLYRAQGGVCWICQRARGIARKLSVDHDHHSAQCSHDAKSACRTCVRGLLCRRCNDLLGHVRDDTDTLYRALWYLAEPPARAVLDSAATTSRTTRR